MGILANPHEEVIRLDITMQYVLLMQQLNPIQHLLANLKHSFQRQFLTVLNEEIL